MPLVARYYDNPGSVEGVDCGPWRAAVGRFVGRAVGLALVPRRRVPVLLPAQGDHRRDQEAGGRGREAIDVVDSLEEQRLKSKSSLSQVINALKAVARARN